MQEKYLSLEIKEQRYLQICAVAILLFIIYQFIFQPYQASMVKIEMKLSYQSKLNNWFKSIDKKLNQLHHQTNRVVIKNSQLLRLTSNSLKQSDLKSHVYELQQSDDGAIQLTFKSAPYVEFINWLEELCLNYKIKIKDLNLNYLHKAGLVSINLRFEA